MTVSGFVTSWRDSRERSALVEGANLAAKAFRSLEQIVPPPKWIAWRDQYNWQYVERLPSQAILQKLARQISTTKALDVLLDHGLLQEVGAIQRMLDEITEDIMFLSFALTTGDWTDKHDAYLRHFWSDDDRTEGVRRKSVRAYVNRAFPGAADPSTADQVGKDLYRFFSDFLHARSSSIIAMISGPPPRYHLGGIFGEIATKPFRDQAPTYGFRCLLSATSATRAIENGELAAETYRHFATFERTFADLITE